MKSVFNTTSAEETMELGEQLVNHLKPGLPILLFGDLGAGKTHFSKGVAKGLGIQEIIKSPTFAYVNKYCTELKNCEVQSAKMHTTPRKLHLFHYDLYRLKQGDDFNSIGLEETLEDLHAVNIIEWADRLGDVLPKEYIRVDFKSLEESHEIVIDFVDSSFVPRTLVEKYWEEWATPMHVREHCKQVAKVAIQVGEALNRKNILVNLDMLNTSALLHDMSRICDFYDMDRGKFQEPITNEKWEKWLEMRKQYKGLHHGDIACGALLEDGYNKTAEVIRLHKARAIIEEAEKFAILEVALLYYADKRVKHDEIVSLQERFRDGRERYGHLNNDSEKAFYQDVERATFELEKQLFGLIDLSPEEVK